MTRLLLHGIERFRGWLLRSLVTTPTVLSQLPRNAGMESNHGISKHGRLRRLRLELNFVERSRFLQRNAKILENAIFVFSWTRH
jgi:hypothetical protein